ncbi:hypothetical protein LCGC14_2484130, partial [marine sediment metagenome]
MPKLIPHIPDGDWVALRRGLNKLASVKLGPGASPTYAELTLNGLTASTLIGANASKLLESVTIGTSLDYTRPTLNTIQDIRTTASPTWLGLTLSDLTQGSVVFAGASGVISQDNSNFFWDNTNKRLEIGTGNRVMLAPLGITGDATTIEDRHEGIWIRGKTTGYIVQVNVRGSRLEIGGGGSLDTAPAMSVNYLTGKVGIGTGANDPNAPLEVKGIKPGEVGGWQSGQLQVTGSVTDEFYSAVITGHNSFGGNTQLWYLGSTSASSHNDIGFINRQNAALHLATNNTTRMTIDAAGDVGIGT